MGGWKFLFWKNSLSNILIFLVFLFCFCQLGTHASRLILTLRFQCRPSALYFWIWFLHLGTTIISFFGGTGAAEYSDPLFASGVARSNILGLVFFILFFKYVYSMLFDLSRFSSWCEGFLSFWRWQLFQPIYVKSFKKRFSVCCLWSFWLTGFGLTQASFRLFRNLESGDIACFFCAIMPIQ